MLRYKYTIIFITILLFTAVVLFTWWIIFKEDFFNV